MKRSIAVLIGTFLITVAIKTPGAWLLYLLSNDTRAMISVQRSEGTVSKGAFHGVRVSLPDDREAFLNSVSFDVTLLSLLRGHFKANFTVIAYAGELGGGIHLAPRRWSIEDINGEFDARALQLLEPTFGSFGTRGRLQLHTPHLTSAYRDGNIEGGVSMSIEALGFDAIIDGRVLGSYQIDLGSDDNGGLSGHLTTLAGSPLLNLDGRVDVASNVIEIQTSVSTAKNAPLELTRLLTALAVDPGDPTTFNWRSTL